MRSGSNHASRLPGPRTWGSHSSRKHPSRRGAGHPTVEPLEGRLLLATGILDPGFGQNGIVTTDFNASNPSVAYCTLVQADGKIVVAGQTRTIDHGMIAALSRFNPDGS